MYARRQLNASRIKREIAEVCYPSRNERHKSHENSETQVISLQSLIYLPFPVHKTVDNKLLALRQYAFNSRGFKLAFNQEISQFRLIVNVVEEIFRW